MKKRQVLLIEPNYKNKYPPIGLMKISTYHKMLGDEVTFFKGDLKQFIVENIYKELLSKLNSIDSSIEWEESGEKIKKYIKLGHNKYLPNFLEENKNKSLILENFKYYKEYYKKKKYFENPEWDRVVITTLFTFYWEKTIDTINFCKNLCRSQDEVKVGGIAASLVPKEIEEHTGIKPHVGLLDKPGIYDDNDIIIDHLPLDYSILDEIEYVYPERNAYYGYMTRGCVNKCTFCAVPKIEPQYNPYISIQKQIDYIRENFGEKRNLLLLDNNVLASSRFNEIIEEIKLCGFDKKTKYVAPNEYEVCIKLLKNNYNNRGCLKNIINQYKSLISKQKESLKSDMYQKLLEYKLLSEDTITKEKVLELDDYFKPHFEKFYKNKPKDRYVDFNQGIDARLINQDNMSKLAEIPIRPLRIAFDDWKLRDIYENAIRIAASNGIREMSNYILYNFNDKPEDLYYRLKLNIDLCDELKINIYSFPMKYHPIQDPKYFMNRNYEGKHWNRKFIRAIQAILNATKGKVGRGNEFFNEAFGSDIDAFNKLLYMPEALIIYREFFKQNGITEKWWNDFNSLNVEKKEIAKTIIEKNNFDNINELTNDDDIVNILRYYEIKRDDAEAVLSK